MKLRPIYFVFALALLSGTGLQAARIVLALYGLELGAQPFTIGVLAATFSFLPILLSVPAGKVADRFGARWPLMLVTTVGALGMLIPYFVPALPAIFAAAAMIGLTDGICDVLLQNLAGLLSDQRSRAKNFSNYSMTRALANSGGPLIGGFAVQHLGHVVACLYVVLLPLVMVAMLVIRSGKLQGGVPQTTHSMGGIRAMLADSGIRRVLITTSLQRAGQDIYQFYMPVYTHAIGLSAFAIGIVLAMNAAAAFVVRLIMPRLSARFEAETILAWAFYIGATCLILVPFFEGDLTLAVISFVFGLGMGCCGPMVTMLMFNSSAGRRSGEAMALRLTVNHIVKLLGPVGFGAVASAVGLLPMFWLNALMMGAGAKLSRTKTRG